MFFLGLLGFINLFCLNSFYFCFNYAELNVIEGPAFCLSYVVSLHSVSNLEAHSIPKPDKRFQSQLMPPE